MITSETAKYYTFIELVTSCPAVWPSNLMEKLTTSNIMYLGTSMYGRFSRISIIISLFRPQRTHLYRVIQLAIFFPPRELCTYHLPIDRHAPQRTSPLRENNLPLLPVHPPPRHPISRFQVAAPGHFRDWSLIEWRAVHCWP